MSVDSLLIYNWFWSFDFWFSPWTFYSEYCIWRYFRELEAPSDGVLLTAVDLLPHVLCVCLDAQTCLTLCDSLDCSPPGSSVLGISQARTLEWVAISFSGGFSWPRDRTCVSCIGRRIVYHWASRESNTWMCRKKMLLLAVGHWSAMKEFYLQKAKNGIVSHLYSFNY